MFADAIIDMYVGIFVDVLVNVFVCVFEDCRDGVIIVGTVVVNIAKCCFLVGVILVGTVVVNIAKCCFLVKAAAEEAEAV